MISISHESHFRDRCPPTCPTIGQERLCSTARNYDYRDQDLGSAAPVLPPGSDLLLASGKDGILYVLDRNKLGKKIADMSVLKSPPIYVTYNGVGLPVTGNIDFPLGNASRNPSREFQTCKIQHAGRRRRTTLRADLLGSRRHVHAQPMIRCDVSRRADVRHTSSCQCASIFLFQRRAGREEMS
jgi:hypothetical protein